MAGIGSIGAKTGDSHDLGNARLKVLDGLVVELAELENGQMVGGLTKGEMLIQRSGPNVIVDDLRVNFDTGEVAGGGRMQLFGGDFNFSGNINSQIDWKGCFPGKCFEGSLRFGEDEGN